MAKISISIPDELVEFVDQQVKNRSALIEALLQDWRSAQEKIALAEACAAVDELQLGWDAEWQQVAISDMEVSGL